MKYSVSLSHQAEADLARAHEWWAENHSVERANRWYASFFRVIPILEENPFRYAKIAESPIFPIELRQFNFGTGRKPTHRAVFTVRFTEVIVVRVRHLAQQNHLPKTTRCTNAAQQKNRAAKITGIFTARLSSTRQSCDEG